MSFPHQCQEDACIYDSVNSNSIRGVLCGQLRLTIMRGRVWWFAFCNFVNFEVKCVYLIFFELPTSSAFLGPHMLHVGTDHPCASAGLQTLPVCPESYARSVSDRSIVQFTWPWICRWHLQCYSCSTMDFLKKPIFFAKWVQ